MRNQIAEFAFGLEGDKALTAFWLKQQGYNTGS